MNKYEAMRIALEALETVRPYEVVDYDPIEKAIEALRQALTEPPNSTTDVVEAKTAKETPQGICRTDGRCQYAIDSGAEGMGWCPEGKCVMPRSDVVEPVGEIVEAHGLIAVSIPKMPPVGTKLYAEPPKREWQGLTDDEITEASKFTVEGNYMLPHSFARAIEAKLREKNT